ncbi:R3H domain [Trypanosoma vivax]|uniref:Putative ATP-dependent DEAD/H RNA helicase n=1 Tax=Trypanosoma vivax (strain Y486) TaxID=1055687 RepID=G0TW96_TRYVY|nr:R3H domain [Trypanosoma vivax]CCC48234.1 putative ATP-dependent DEAD/H RNA helicase [Trypanosoma vivax Y486]
MPHEKPTSGIGDATLTAKSCSKADLQSLSSSLSVCSIGSHTQGNGSYFVDGNLARQSGERAKEARFTTTNVDVHQLHDKVDSAGTATGCGDYLCPQTGGKKQLSQENQGSMKNVDQGAAVSFVGSFKSKKQLKKILREFINNPNTNDLTFHSLNKAERALVHSVANSFKLEHKSSGAKPNRVLKVSKRIASVVPSVKRENKRDEAVKGDSSKRFMRVQELPARYLTGAIGDIRKMVTPLLKNAPQKLVMVAGKKNKKEHFVSFRPGLHDVPKTKVPAHQLQELRKFREALPSYRKRHEIVAAVKKSDVVIICGSTGCGKTTQVPQLIYDSGIFPKERLVICTQPRRISALSVAQRVAEERGEACGNSCGYIIRFENVTSSKTKIIYMTTGMLLRRLQVDPLLPEVSCVIIDEVHERDVETDICLLLIRDRILKQRRNPAAYKHNLKLVAMSATVQIEKVTSYFSNTGSSCDTPVIEVPGSLFPVKEHFLEDAVECVGMNLSEIPLVSVFEYIANTTRSGEGRNDSVPIQFGDAADALNSKSDNGCASLVPHELVARLICHIHSKSSNFSESILVFLPGWRDISVISVLVRGMDEKNQLLVLMLHSEMGTRDQQRVFYSAPQGFRKVVLSTNIAETSITIDDVVFVIDTCLSKSICYDPSENTTSLKVGCVSKANCRQRRGRAGRCSPGECFHLIPRSTYDLLPEFLSPSILRTPLHSVCLSVKCLMPDEKCIDVLKRALDIPSNEAITHAIDHLIRMDALTKDERPTCLGLALSEIPIAPHLGKMLIMGTCFGVLEPIAIVAAYLEGKSPFIKPIPELKEARFREILKIDGGDLSDHLTVVKLFNGWKQSGYCSSYAAENYADQLVLLSMDRMRKQLVDLMKRSQFLREYKNPMHAAYRNSNNIGLARFVIIRSLYPQVSSIEIQKGKNGSRVYYLCWDDKLCAVVSGSPLGSVPISKIKNNGFIFYNARMRVESGLKIMEATAATPVEAALCMDKLTVKSGESVMECLEQNDGNVSPPFPYDQETKFDNASVLCFDERKLYISPGEVATTLKDIKYCIDRYLELAMSRVRCDLFPDGLVRVVASMLGYRLSGAGEQRQSCIRDDDRTAQMSHNFGPVSVITNGLSMDSEFFGGDSEPEIEIKELSVS